MTLTIPDITYLQTNNIIINELAYKEVTTSESGGFTQIGKYNSAKIKGLYCNTTQVIPMPANWDNYSLSSSYGISYGTSADIYVIMDNESLTGQVEVSNKWDIIKADTIEETNINRDFPFYNSKWENGCCVSVPEINETGDFLTKNNSQITYTRDGDNNSLTANMFIEDTETTPTVIYVPGNHVKRILYNQCTDGYVYAIPDYGYSLSSSSPQPIGVAGGQKVGSPLVAETQTIGSTIIKRVEATDSGVFPPEVSSVTSEIYQRGPSIFQEVVTATFKNPNTATYYLKYKTSSAAAKYTTVEMSANSTTTVKFYGAPTSSSTSSGTLTDSIIAFFANTNDDNYYKHSYLIHVSINGGTQSTTTGINAGRDVYIESSDVRENLSYTTKAFDITTFRPTLSYSGGYMYLSNYADIPESARSHICPVLVRHLHHGEGRRSHISKDSTTKRRKTRYLHKYTGPDKTTRYNMEIDWTTGKITNSNTVLDLIHNSTKAYEQHTSIGRFDYIHDHQYVGLSLNYYSGTVAHSLESTSYIDLKGSTMTKTFVA